jgi:hypothetical protein
VKKYFCIADAHSFYNEMMRALNEAGYDKNNPNHIFVSCGDMFDRGPQSREVFDFLNSILNEQKILIKGNHEYLMKHMITTGDWPRRVDELNGTWRTACDLTGVDVVEVCRAMRKNDAWWQYYNDCKPYAEIGNYILVHGWVPCVSNKDYTMSVMEDWRDCSEIEWDEAAWLNGMHCWRKGARIDGKTIVCGHWNTSWGWSMIRNKCICQYDGDAIHDAFIDEGIVALDACTVVSHKVNCFVFEA